MINLAEVNCTGDCCNFTDLANCTGGKTYINGQKLLFHKDIWTTEVVQRIVIIGVIMFMTLVGNSVIIATLTCSRYKRLNSRVNIFIVNLAVGDLAVCCFTMTTEVLFVVFEGAWVFGAVACKIVVYGQILTLASTTFILISMSIDRYLALCRPLSMTNTPARARRMIALAWALAFVFASPQLAIFKQVPVGVYKDDVIKYKCKSQGYSAWWQRKLYFTFLTAYILVIPTVIITFCYVNVIRVVWNQDRDVTLQSGGVALRRTQRRKNNSVPKAKVKTIKMTLCIILSFVALWTPYFVVHLIRIWSEYKYKISDSMMVFAETAALVNSALNPIVYGCFNIRFSKELKDSICFKRSRPPDDYSRPTMDESTLLEVTGRRSPLTGQRRLHARSKILFSASKPV